MEKARKAVREERQERQLGSQRKKVRMEAMEVRIDVICFLNDSIMMMMMMEKSPQQCLGLGATPKDIVFRDQV